MEQDSRVIIEDYISHNLNPHRTYLFLSDYSDLLTAIKENSDKEKLLRIVEIAEREEKNFLSTSDFVHSPVPDADNSAYHNFLKEADCYKKIADTARARL